MSDIDRESGCSRQPLYLLADSQLLFWERRGRPLLEAALDGLARDTELRAAYVGASNGDRPEFYEIFEAAMDDVGIVNRRMIDSSFGPDDRTFLEGAQLIVLAGGDVRLGWTTFERTGMKDVILGRYNHGAVLVGISAGAIQLGQYAIVEAPESSATELLDVFNLAPAVIDNTRRASQLGAACRARFCRCGERPPGSESLPGAGSSCTRTAPSSPCGVLRISSGSAATTSRTHCCPPKRATDLIVARQRLLWRYG